MQTLWDRSEVGNPLPAVEEPTAISCSMGPRKEGPGHGFSCMYGEKDR